jgi:ribosomal protein L2
LSYILAADGMRAGDVVQSYMSGIPEDLWQSMGGTVDPGVLAARTAWRGNCLPLHMIPVGTLIFNVGLRPGKGGQLCRSAGTHATVVAKGSDSRQQEIETDQPEEEKKPLTLREKQKQERLAQHITVRLSSGETRLIHKDCCATIGVASNPNYHYTQLGKAGRSRWLNIRPTVRGLAMNAMDHPHGGGRGKSKGNVDPKSPWGIPVSSSFPSIEYSIMTTLLTRGFSSIIDQVRLQDSSQVEDQQGCRAPETSQPRPTSPWIQLDCLSSGNIWILGETDRARSSCFALRENSVLLILYLILTAHGMAVRYSFSIFFLPCILYSAVHYRGFCFYHPLFIISWSFGGQRGLCIV